MEVKWRDKESIRPVKIHRGYLKNPEGSVLFEIGNTKVLCTATVQDRVPAFVKGTGEGWLSAEYALLPRSTQRRNIREGRSGRFDARSIEISRMIGRALRGVLDLSKMKDYSIIIDCDVLQADGGTRTASITAGFCALYDAVQFMLRNGLIKENPIREFIAAISVGKVGNDFLLDITYEEDFQAEVDLNVAMTESKRIVEIQGTAEKRPFTVEELNQMVELAWKGIKKLIELQKEALRKPYEEVYS